MPEYEDPKDEPDLRMNTINVTQMFAIWCAFLALTAVCAVWGQVAVPAHVYMDAEPHFRCCLAA